MSYKIQNPVLAEVLALTGKTCPHCHSVLIGERWEQHECPEMRAARRAENGGGAAPIPGPGTVRSQKQQEPPPPPLPFIDMSDWDDEPVPQRKWAIFNRVPLNQAGLFSGQGGTGKSIIELMKDVAHVSGKDWLGSMPEQGAAFYIGAEDDIDELHIRLANIATYYQVTFKELVDGGLNMLCLLGQDATLCAATGKSGKVEVTQLYRQLYERAGDIKPKNISIDTLSRAFAGSELDRVQVYAFAMHMQALAMVADGSVTVLSHPSLSGISDGRGFSGSTAWDGAFRFRQYLTAAKSDEGADDNVRQLEFKKIQYGPKVETVIVRYERGLFLPVAGVSTLDKIAREARVDELFQKLVNETNQRNEKVSSRLSAHEYAPTVFARNSDSKAASIKKNEFETAMERLFKADKIHLEQYGHPSRDTWKIVTGPSSKQKDIA
jgi:RecA-family ATPase